MKKLKKLAYSFGAVATALSYQAFSTYIIFFYVDVMKLGVKLAAFGMLVWGIWNAVNDPLFGFISDRTRTPWGRRIPYIAIFAIPFGVIYFLLWTPPSALQNEWLLFLYFLIFICLFDLCYTIVVLNWASLFPEMFPSLKERAEVNSYRQSFGMGGLILGIAVPPLIYGSLGWRWMGLIFGAIIIFAYLISLWGSKENKIFSKEKPLGFKSAFKNTFANHSFLTFVFANLFVQYAFVIILASIPFYAKYVLEIKEGKTSIILLATFVVAILMMFVWRKILVKFGAKNSYMAALIVLAIVLVPFLFLNNFYAAIVACGLVGIGLSGIILTADVLISDIIDEDELKTKSRREGMYFGTNAFVTRFAIALEAASMGFIFHYTHYNPHIFTQTKEFLMGLRALVAAFPILALSFALIFMGFYPLGRKKLAKMRSELAQLHNRLKSS
ncbi:MAG: MFS transporter [Candidatus Margulisbacteria bacterium]|nr:MFS transporter [Candidatus Margulisiibacteriota bacterium]MBU1022612.1 MFS transporter [Candidatus Margulisiibacteriota bacterium]MBU1955026.1 MFS transporter [Candidatus Margulisiibacteriota bacterium]